jgi:hypothetical protein
MKDIFGWYLDPRQEAINKFATLPRLLGEVAPVFGSGKDWKGDPIADPDATMLQQLQQYLSYVVNDLGPIALRPSAKPNPQTAIGGVERFFGVRPAGMPFTDPEGYRDFRGALAEPRVLPGAGLPGRRRLERAKQRLWPDQP